MTIDHYFPAGEENQGKGIKTLRNSSQATSNARTLLLITASSPEIQRIRRSRVLNFQQITMPYLAALVPPHWTVLHVDEAAEPVDLEVLVNLVAITAGDIEYAKALFREIVPHRKWWSSQTSIQAANDDEFLELAARSGCKQLFVGLESVSQASVNEVSKEFNRVDQYARAIERIHAHGIAVQAGIIFGFDNDTEAMFDETVEFLEATGVQNATFNILTPFPGTRLHQRLEAESRILTRDWTRYNGRSDVVYQPRHMSPKALLDGYQRAYARFYSWRSICRRLSRSQVQMSWVFPLNLAYALARRYR